VNPVAHLVGDILVAFGT